ncbi:MAG: hypothetical protein U0746_04170 [Gemmataceae bacterium]
MDGGGVRGHGAEAHRHRRQGNAGHAGDDCQRLPAVRELFEVEVGRDYDECGTDSTEEICHGREESRYIAVLADPVGLLVGWPDVATVVELTQQRYALGRLLTVVDCVATTLYGRSRPLTW